MQDLIARAKAKPGSISYGSPGVGTPHHMAMELFKTQTHLFMLHVPYRGTAGYTQDLLSGEVNVGFLPVHVAQGFVKSGRLMALAVGSAKRHPVAPDVATFDELGVKGVDVDLWYAFFVPAEDAGRGATAPEQRDRCHPQVARGARVAGQGRPGCRFVHTGRTHGRGAQGLPALGRGDPAQRHFGGLKGPEA